MDLEKENSDSALYNRMKEYFIAKGVPLTDKDMAQIAGPKSMLAQAKNVVTGNIRVELKSNDDSDLFYA